MKDKFGNIYKQARTTKVISGSCIDTIPIDTIFWVIDKVKADHSLDMREWDDSVGYRNCKGLHISSVFLDEYKFLD